MRKELIQKVNTWFKNNQGKIGFFNIFVMILVVLRSAGYFHPYYPITVNFIVFVSVVVAVVLFNLKSKAVILLSIAFWVFAAGIRILHVDVWAERTTIYVFQTFIVGVILLISEYIYFRK
jgi:hypothetical protein